MVAQQFSHSWDTVCRKAKSLAAQGKMFKDVGWDTYTLQWQDEE